MDHQVKARLLAGVVETVNLRSRDGFTSANLFNEVASLQPGQISKLEAGLQWLKNHNIRGVIVGGTAVVHYVAGARSLTPDIDVMTDEIEKVEAAAHADGLTIKPVAPAITFRFGGDSIGLQVEEFNTDFLDARRGNVKLNQHILKTARPARIGGGTFPMINPEVLALWKFDLGREKDDADAFMLLKSGHFNKAAYKAAAKSLGKSLQDPESVALYGDMIP